MKIYRKFATCIRFYEDKPANDSTWAENCFVVAQEFKSLCHEPTAQDISEIAFRVLGLKIVNEFGL